MVLSTEPRCGENVFLVDFDASALNKKKKNESVYTRVTRIFFKRYYFLLTSDVCEFRLDAGVEERSVRGHLTFIISRQVPPDVHNGYLVRVRFFYLRTIFNLNKLTNDINRFGPVRISILSKRFRFKRHLTVFAHVL